MSEPQQRPDDRYLLVALSQELVRCNDNRVYLLAVMAQQAEQIAELQAVIQAQTTDGGRDANP